MRRDVAVALGYRPREDAAPRVLASGDGEWADRIRRIAEDRGIPVHTDDDLATLLADLPLAEEIPPELYPVVAEIFVYLQQLSRDWVASRATDARSE